VVTPAEFKASLAQSAPSSDLSVAVQALWWAGKDDWDQAHKLVVGADGADAAWVHAYLHRVEGDLGNAGYWYGQAKQPAATSALKDEWTAIAAALLAHK
jgi:hypothetical protein